MTRRTLRPLDIALGIALALLFIRLSAPNAAPAPEEVRISADGASFSEPLLPDRTLEVKGPLGITTIEIRGKKARIAASPCLGKQCVRMGWAEEGSGAAICAPNRVAVEVAGGGGGVDAILH